MSEEITNLKIKHADLSGKQVFLERELQMHREESRDSINQLRESSLKLEETVDRRISDLGAEMRNGSKILNTNIALLSDTLKHNAERQDKTTNRILWVASLAAVAIIVSLTTAGLNPTVTALGKASSAVKAIK